MLIECSWYEFYAHFSTDTYEESWEMMGNDPERWKSIYKAYQKFDGMIDTDWMLANWPGYSEWKEFKERRIINV